MTIKCQEHYDKVVEYAKSIGDKTLQRCIEDLKQWEKNSNGKSEIELYWIWHHILSDSPKGHPTDGQASSEGCSITAGRTNPFPKSWSRSTAGAYTRKCQELKM